MKLKGIGKFEHHVEELFFLVFFLFFLFVLVGQLGLLPGGTNTVKVGSKDVPIDRAMVEVASLAERKLAELGSESINERIPESVPSVLAMFDSAMSSGSSQAVVLASLGKPQLIIDSGGVPRGTEGPQLPGEEIIFAQVVPPVPSAPLARVHGCSIDPETVAQVGPELAKLLPPAQPFDVRAVTVEAKFDAAAFRNMLTAPGGGAQPVPENFWAGRAEILDVVWVRQMLGSDGQWEREEILPPMPGRFSMRDRLEGDPIDVTQLRDVLEDERGNRGDIRRPALYSYVSGEPWLWPSFGIEEARDPDLQVKVDGLLADLRRTRQKIDQLEKALGKRTSWLPGPTGEDEELDWPIIPRTWRAQFGGGNSGGDRAPAPTRDREAERKVRLEAQLKDALAKEAQIVADLAELGLNDEGKDLDTAQMLFTEGLDSLSRGDLAKVTLWHHDLTAQPGSTYRYQARVRITNPFFGFADQLPADQRDLATPLYLESDASEWTQPVELQPEVVYFVKTAAPAGDGPLGAEPRASIDLYEFYYGYWRLASVNVNPGDLLAGSVDLPELVTWSIETGEEGGHIATALPTSRIISTTVFMLDAADAVDAERDEAQVFLGSTEGAHVAIRYASRSLSDDEIYQRLSASAADSLTAKLREPGSAIPLAGGGAGDSPTAPGGNPIPGDTGDEDGDREPGSLPGGLPSRKSGF